MTDRISDEHLRRRAILYVRQSTTQQVMNNEESRRLQYAMRQRLEGLGWRNIEVVDDDLGQSASSGESRAGFERMLSEVCLGRVGVVAAREVSRFARNSRDWQQLIEICRMVDTLLIDQETIYDPRLGNDRLLLGVKGSLNEYELDLLRQRSLEARYEKARRGELVVAVPIGYVKTNDRRIEKDPDRRVRQVIELMFKKFLELGTMRQTLLWFVEEGIELPGWERDASTAPRVVWKRARYSTVQRVLTGPVYAGAYVYGQTEPAMRYREGKPVRVLRRKRREDTSVVIRDHHEAYIDWETHRRILGMIEENQSAGFSRGAARKGEALLSGLLRCRRCGRKISVAYTGTGRQWARYTCVRGRLDCGEPTCITFSSKSVDEAVAEELFRVVSPAAVAAAKAARDTIAQQANESLAVLQNELQAAEFEAQRAWRQFDAVDPENRLVADELERRWNDKLAAANELRRRTERHRDDDARDIVARVRDLGDLATDLHAAWADSATDVRLRKRLLRALVEEIICDVDPAAGEVELTIHWQGGVHTKLSCHRRRRGASSARATPEVVQAVEALTRVLNDRQIAGYLNRNGLLTGMGNRWTESRVQSLRRKRGIQGHSGARQEQEGWVTLSGAAKSLGVTQRSVRRAIRMGRIRAEHPLPDGPWIIQRSDLMVEPNVWQPEAEDVQTKATGLPRATQNTLFSSVSPGGAS